MKLVHKWNYFSSVAGIFYDSENSTHTVQIQEIMRMEQLESVKQNGISAQQGNIWNMEG